MRKEEKPKVGRPKLADAKTKRESLLVCLFVLIITVMVSVIGYKMLMIDFNPKYLVGTVYNKNVNSCVNENNKIDCGPNVTYLKYKLSDGKYVEVNKQYENIKVDLENNKILELCYKTNTVDVKCVK